MYIHNVKLTYNHLITGVAAPLSLTAESGDVATNTASDSVAMGTVATETSESDSYYDLLASSSRPRPRRRSGGVASQAKTAGDDEVQRSSFFVKRSAESGPSPPPLPGRKSRVTHGGPPPPPRPVPLIFGARHSGAVASRAKTAGDDGVARVESFSSPRWMGIKPVPDGGPPPLPERKGRVAPPPVPDGGPPPLPERKGRVAPPPVPLGGTLFGASVDGRGGPPPIPTLLGFGASSLGGPPPPQAPLSEIRDGYIAGDLQATCSVRPPPPPPPAQLSGPPPRPPKVGYGAALLPCGSPPPPPLSPLSGLPPPSPPVPLSGPPPLAFGFGAALPPGGPPPPPPKVRYGAVLPLRGPPPPPPPAPLSGPPPPPPPRVLSRQSITGKFGVARGMLGLPPPPSKPSEATEPQPPSEKKKKAKAVGLQPQAAPCPRRSLGDRGGTESVTVNKEERVAHMYGSPRGGGGGGGGRGSFLSSIKSGVNLKVCMLKDFVYTKSIATHTVGYECIEHFQLQYLPQL